MDFKELKSYVKEILIDKGYKSKSSSYYKINDELIVCLNIQKSKYNNSVYFNLSIFIRQLMETHSETPRFVDGHVRTRLKSQLIGPNGLEYEELNKSVIIEIFTENLEFIEHCDSTEDVSKLLVKYPVLAYQLKSNARLFFNK